MPVSMLRKLPAYVPLRRVLALATLALALPLARASAQDCPAASGGSSARGWEAWRADSIEEAARRFRQALSLCSRNLDATVGLGYVALRQGAPHRADTLFSDVTRRDPLNLDAWIGLALAQERTGQRQAAIAGALRVITQRDTNATVTGILDRLDPEWRRGTPPLRSRPSALQLTARTRGSGFEVLTNSGWRPFWIKGINLGAALPGRFPSEFPRDSTLYADWLGLMAGMNANTVRLYTILPPEFYRALRGWNLSHPDSTLWLVHGVWTELPPGHRFDAPEWEVEFVAETRRVVDAVHGAAVLTPRPGHASGRYDASVAQWTLGYIVGREWEPYAVAAFDSADARRADWRGRFLQAKQAPAMERWLARIADGMLAHEFEQYHALRPIAWTSWPTLDPLTHPTEATGAEERVLRERAGRPLGRATLEYDNDLLGLDANLVQPTLSNPAGVFASYHAYPYYPDFMNLDPGYGRARSQEGRSNYAGYLRDLVGHHAGMPVVISEYGVPSSRGNAHLQAQGFDHGGHDEADQARIDARLTRELHQTGTAGGMLFAWIDEWFKKNWLVIDFEIPLENTRRWHNVMDAEQHYGVLATTAGDSATRPVLGGDPSRWASMPLVARRDAPPGMPATLRVSSDASYVYLAIETRGAFPWTTHGLEIGIDTWGDSTGQHALPRRGAAGAMGFEFVVQLASPDSGAMKALPEYNRYAALDQSGDDRGRFHRRPITVVDRTDGRFDPMLVVTNRARHGRDGTFFKAQQVDRGRLKFGTEAQSTLNDWYHDVGAGMIELRLPWDLLNVTDPSTRTLLLDRTGTGPFGTVKADDFHFVVSAYDRRTGASVQLGPSRAWRWAEWEEPEWHVRVKPVYDSMRTTWKALP